MTTALNELEKLQDYAYNSNISVSHSYYASPHKGYCCQFPVGSAIMLNGRAIQSPADELCTLAEEIGHIKPGTMLPYCDYIDPKYKRWVKCKNEIRATRYAINMILPPSLIQEAIDEGYYCIYAIAAYCGVTVEFLEEAFEYYGWD